MPNKSIIRTSLIWLRQNAHRIVQIISILVIISMVVGGILLFSPIVTNYTQDDLFFYKWNTEHDPSRPTITLAFDSPVWRTYKNYSRLNTSGVAITVEKLENPRNPSWKDGGCYVGVELFSSAPHFNPRGQESYFLNFDWDFCFKENIRNVDISNARVSRNLYSIAPYYFPFDYGYAEIYVELSGKENVNGDFIVRDVPGPNVIAHVFYTDEWDVMIKNQTRLDDRTILEVDYKRPLIYRVLTVVIFMALVLVILVSPFLKETGGFLEVLVGLIFGIWGIRQVIIPSFVTWPTIIDALTLGIYFLMCLAIFIRVVIFPIESWANNISNPSPIIKSVARKITKYARKKIHRTVSRVKKTKAKRKK